MCSSQYAPYIKLPKFSLLRPQDTTAMNRHNIGSQDAVSIHFRSESTNVKCLFFVKKINESIKCHKQLNVLPPLYWMLASCWRVTVNEFWLSQPYCNANKKSKSNIHVFKYTVEIQKICHFPCSHFPRTDIPPISHEC